MANRLSDAEVVEVRARYAAGARQVDLAAAFGIAQNTVSAIVTGRTRAAAGGPIAAPAARAERPAAAAPSSPSTPRRPPLTTAQCARIIDRVRGGEPRVDVAAAFGVSRFTIDSVMVGRIVGRDPDEAAFDDATLERMRDLHRDGVTQTEIARRMGTSQQMVSKALRSPDGR
ncbi:hypothetical protein [Demequina sp.]|uniref:hypothetical protein n=1 Tax=Demequina sp. TaxID=2050685 RepID=UPI0025E9F545|nr:hypothetical protein [Demequina sp.]